MAVEFALVRGSSSCPLANQMIQWFWNKWDSGSSLFRTRSEVLADYGESRIRTPGQVLLSLFSFMPKTSTAGKERSGSPGCSMSKNEHCSSLYGLGAMEFVNVCVRLLRAGICEWRLVPVDQGVAALGLVRSRKYREAISDILNELRCGRFRFEGFIYETIKSVVGSVYNKSLDPFDSIGGRVMPSRVLSVLGPDVSGRPYVEAAALREFSRGIRFWSLSATSFRQYVTGFRSYARFAAALTVILPEKSSPRILPARESDVLLWVSGFRNVDTAKNYVSHLRKWHTWLNLDTKWDSPIIRESLNGLKRFLNNPPPFRPRIGPALLHDVVSTSLSEGKALLALGCILAYAFLLRVPSELLKLRATNLVVEGQVVKIRLDSRKNAPGGETLRRGCCCVKDSLVCPVEAAKILLRRYGSRSHPLFYTLGYRKFLLQLRDSLKLLNVSESGRYGTHALRRGHAHALAMTGSSYEKICAMGSWKPGSTVPARVYIDVSEVQQIACDYAVPFIEDSESESDD
ncbi:hypothetical protein FOZ62_003563 [Perkinsus olseni]|uniref:Tyr recombinase domain-containing protein n=1 Tax=Perkinsus olseni TaxID=32597 RepID=A0A7J6QP42_PEROL|nr:hypothetical protein FOZ62_003563 [Perkinsus olseni]